MTRFDISSFVKENQNIDEYNGRPRLDVWQVGIMWC